MKKRENTHLLREHCKNPWNVSRERLGLGLGLNCLTATHTHNIRTNSLNYTYHLLNRCSVLLLCRACCFLSIVCVWNGSFVCVDSPCCRAGVKCVIIYTSISVKKKNVNLCVLYVLMSSLSLSGALAAQRSATRARALELDSRRARDVAICKSEIESATTKTSTRVERFFRHLLKMRTHAKR